MAPFRPLFKIVQNSAAKLPGRSTFYSAIFYLRGRIIGQLATLLKDRRNTLVFQEWAFLDLFLPVLLLPLVPLPILPPLQNPASEASDFSTRLHAVFFVWVRPRWDASSWDLLERRGIKFT